MTESDVHDEYFDTTDLRLAGRGIALYRRTGGGDEGWHLELDRTGPQRRRTEPLGTAESPPSAIAEAVQAYQRGRPLEPVARVRTSRRTSPLIGSGGRVVAEVSDDHIWTEPLVGDGASDAWREWRIEVADGPPEVGEALRHAFAGTKPDRGLSHLARALGAEMPDQQATRPRPKDRAAGAFLDYAEAQVDALLELDPLVREDAPDSVHRMRVACRRLRSALSTYRVSVGKERGKGLRDELRWLGQILGRVRDAEVMRERLEDLVRAEPADLVMGPVDVTLAEDLGAEYHQGSAALAEALASDRYFSLLDALEALADDLAARRGTKGGKSEKLTVEQLTKRDARRLTAAVQAAAVARGTDDADRHLHEARKAAKKLRYAAESASAFGAKTARRIEKRSHRVQQVLGDHQDSVVTAELLRRLAVEAYGRGENAFSYGRLHAHEQHLAEAAEAQFYRLRDKLPGSLGGS
ncbi:CHAD domain-containing protein [Sinomonas sp. B1-1]|uniref:CYTH and CHAD domain-containing protein n=1 Tax=Sinomonas sp. B1-1 TaxID=3141454 RepID=UPI003D2BB887